jgi:hypothetical protein
MSILYFQASQGGMLYYERRNELAVSFFHLSSSPRFLSLLRFIRTDIFYSRIAKDISGFSLVSGYLSQWTESIYLVKSCHLQGLALPYSRVCALCFCYRIETARTCNS